MGLYISLTGTESTGKTTLAQRLAAHYRAPLIPDYSRIIAGEWSHAYTAQDVYTIAQKIVAEEDRYQTHSGLIITDNCLVNIIIWLQYYQWQVPQWLQDKVAKHQANHFYLLCDIDVEWEKDNLRSNPDNRAELLTRFIHHLSDLQANYQLITGLGEERFQNALKAIENYSARQ